MKFRGPQSHRKSGEIATEKWSTSRPGDSKARRFGRFVVDWIKVSWKDVLALAILGAASQAIYSAPAAAIRTFPITFDTSGDVVFPQFAYPERGWIISPGLSGVLSVLIPIGVVVLAQIRIRSFWDMNNAILGVLYSVVLGTLFQVIIKQLIGGLRPYFLDVCQPDISRAAANNNTRLNGVGFHQIMFSVDVCTNPNKQAIKNAMTSFPSGHSTAAFAGYVFLFLWMNAKLKVWGSHQTSFYWLALLMAPLLGAALMACALTIDQAHNWYDILAGSTIGTVMAFASYRICYASIWDWRYNHIPLTRTHVFDYPSIPGPDDLARAVFIQKLGWGRSHGKHSAAVKDGHGSLPGVRNTTQGTDLPATHGTLNGSQSSHVVGPTYPPTAGGRGGNGYHGGRLRGDEIV